MSCTSGMSIALAIPLRYTNAILMRAEQRGAAGHQNDVAPCDWRKFATFRDL
jgi:hypothetical protein